MPLSITANSFSYFQSMCTSQGCVTSDVFVPRENVNRLAQVNDQSVCLTLRLASSNRLIRLSFAVRMGLEAAKLRM